MECRFIMFCFTVKSMAFIIEGFKPSDGILHKPFNKENFATSLLETWPLRPACCDQEGYSWLSRIH